PICLVEAARALALLRGRSYVLVPDMTDLVGDVFRHRLMLSYEALAEGLTADDLLQRIQQAVPVPDQPLQTHAEASSAA
ncbi:MAG TPA: ATPase, partial [Burkholderiaceae bacterium]|nr:ATPase [Burkholderiaceae bacterium]